MAHGDGREGKWRGNWRMEWVASTLHATWEHGVSIITTADAHTSAASSRMNWRHRRFKWTRPFRRKAKSGFCACAITFQTQSTCVTLQQTFVIVTADLTQGSVILREEASVLRRIDRFSSLRIKKAKLFYPLTFLWTLDVARSSESWCPEASIWL